MSKDSSTEEKKSKSARCGAASPCLGCLVIFIYCLVLIATLIGAIIGLKGSYWIWHDACNVTDDARDSYLATHNNGEKSIHPFCTYGFVHFVFLILSLLFFLVVLGFFFIYFKCLDQLKWRVIKSILVYVLFACEFTSMWIALLWFPEDHKKSFYVNLNIARSCQNGQCNVVGGNLVSVSDGKIRFDDIKKSAYCNVPGAVLTLVWMFTILCCYRIGSYGYQAESDEYEERSSGLAEFNKKRPSLRVGKPVNPNEQKSGSSSSGQPVKPFGITPKNVKSKKGSSDSSSSDAKPGKRMMIQKHSHDSSSSSEARKKLKKNMRKTKRDSASSTSDGSGSSS